MNAAPCIILAIVATLSGCTGHRNTGIVGLPPNPHRGAPRAVLNVSQPIIRGRNHLIEFALLGSPRHSELQAPVAYQFTLLIPTKILHQEIAWVNPRVSRFFVWVIPGHYTLGLRSDYLTIHVEVSNLAGYTYSGVPLLTKPFARAVVRLRLSHPVAGGQVGQHFETPYFVL